MVLICIKHLVIFFSTSPFYTSLHIHCIVVVQSNSQIWQLRFRVFKITQYHPRQVQFDAFISSHRYCFLPIHCNVMDLWFNNTVIQVHRIRQGYRMTSDGNYLLTKLSNVSPFCTQSWQCYHWTHSTVDQYLHVQPLNELTEISNLIDLAVSLLVHPHW